MESILEIKIADITELEKDAIVNAANEYLAAGGGVCGAIFSKAGMEEMQKACDAYGECETGSAVMTPGFALPAKHVIHAVGPIWQGGSFGEEEQLKSCYTKALSLAMEKELHSIAFPLISSGIYGYPKEAAWKVALKTVLQFQKKNEEYPLDVTFAVLDELSLALGNRLLEEEKDFLAKSRMPIIDETLGAKFAFFWKLDHNNEEFSNWYASDFTIEGITYNCVEQYMMAKKSLLFFDTMCYEAIMKATSPREMKNLGKMIHNFNDETWDKAKDEIVYHGCYAKFAQNPKLSEKLLATGDAILAEASPLDTVWGIGMARTEIGALTPASWKGENRLGRILERVREQLKKRS